VRRVALFVSAALLLVAVAFVLPVNRWALALVEWIRGAGTIGVGVFAVAYVVATVSLLPGSILTAGAGFAYGPIVGTLIVSPVSVFAATCAFVLSRSVAREWISARIAQDSRFTAIDHAIGGSGFRMVALLRLSPVFPFNLLNYALGLTQVRTRDFIVASWLGMLPGTFLYVYLGSLVTNASELMAGAPSKEDPWTQAVYWAGLLATLAVTVLITRIARKALHDELARAETPLPAEEKTHP
jgi:uncharacterized membrane protein YdjX (TVP38/TMEM64 family)